MKKLISIVIPVYNEQNNVGPCFQALNHLSKDVPHYDFEFLFTDNASTDLTSLEIEKLCAADPRVKYARYSSNVGYQCSIYIGHCLAKGDAVVELDCDLEDPPELIKEFIQKWESGFEVVYGIRLGRQESRLKTFFRKIFYRLMSRASDIELPNDAGDFRLVDRKIVNILKQVPEREPYLRGLVAALGFRQTGIPYHRNARNAGHSKFNLLQNFNLALQGMVGFTKAPMRIAIYLGVIMSCLGFLAAIAHFLFRVFGLISQPGVSEIVILILISWSTIMLFLGLIGEYVATILLETRGRPRAILERHKNLEVDSLIF